MTFIIKAKLLCLSPGKSHDLLCWFSRITSSLFLRLLMQHNLFILYYLEIFYHSIIKNNVYLNLGHFYFCQVWWFHLCTCKIKWCKYERHKPTTQANSSLLPLHVDFQEAINVGNCNWLSVILFSFSFFTFIWNMIQW